MHSPYSLRTDCCFLKKERTLKTHLLNAQQQRSTSKDVEKVQSS